MLATWGFHELTFGRLQVWCNWATIAIATRSLRQLLEHVHTLIKMRINCRKQQELAADIKTCQREIKVISKFIPL